MTRLLRALRRRCRTFTLLVTAICVSTCCCQLQHLPRVLAGSNPIERVAFAMPSCCSSGCTAPASEETPHGSDSRGDDGCDSCDCVRGLVGGEPVLPVLVALPPIAVTLQPARRTPCDATTLRTRARLGPGESLLDRRCASLT